MSDGINPKNDKEKILPYIQDAEEVMKMLESDYELAIYIAKLLMKLDDNGLLDSDELEKDDDNEINSLAQWLLKNSEYYFEKAREEAEELIKKDEDPRGKSYGRIKK